MAAVPPADATPPSASYARYVLTLLVVVYVLNFIDRQILSILAEDIKRDLGLSDADMGFLYGTAFGVFYALFGIPLGRLADSWNRVKLMSTGLAIWSAATAASASGERQMLPRHTNNKDGGRTENPLFRKCGMLC